MEKERELEREKERPTIRDSIFTNTIKGNLKNKYWHWTDLKSSTKSVESWQDVIWNAHLGLKHELAKFQNSFGPGL